MTVTIYLPKDNGDLKYVADVEDEDRPDMALDALLDEMPRIGKQNDTFVALVGTVDDGTLCTLTVGDEEPIQRPKRNIAISNGFSATGEEDVEEEADEDEEEAEPEPPKRRPTPRGRAKSSGNGRRRGADKRGGTATKTAPKRREARKTPFTRRADGDE